MPVFFQENDYRYYLKLLSEWCTEYQVDLWAYCLMTNHVHLIAVPSDLSGLSQALAQVHKRYTMYINKREDWSGYLWQGRFQSYVMDESYCLNAVRYVENNPVAAGIVHKAQDYAWSSAASHVYNRPDSVLNDSNLRSMISNWDEYLSQEEKPVISEQIAKSLKTGKELGTHTF